MPACVVRLLPEAEAEVQRQEFWYSLRSEKSAQAFLVELDQALSRIAATPETFPRYRRGTRRFVMQRFPYSVVYRRLGRFVYVVAVASARQKPGYWRQRKIP